MKSGLFSARYDTARSEPASDSDLATAGFRSFKAVGKVRGQRLTPEAVAQYFPGGRLIGSWGGMVQVAAGDMIVMPYPGGGEIYTINSSLFDKTYQLEENYTPSQEEAVAHWADLLQNEEGSLYRKEGVVFAKTTVEDPEAQKARGGGFLDVELTIVGESQQNDQIAI